MSNITKFFAADSPERKKYRRIFQGNNGTTTFNWPVPDNALEVEVHCWGAGGAGNAFGGGGGGGYVTHVFPVSPTDVLQITVGAYPGGTSSVSIPTQSPNSPISATGGGVGSPFAGPNVGTPVPGGSGSFTIAAGISTGRTFKASGGSGGGSGIGGPGYYGQPYVDAGGGAAGSPLGNGGNGSPGPAGGGGGGIGMPGFGSAGGGSIGPRQEGLYGTNSPNLWYYPDEILGSYGPLGAGPGCGGNGSRTPGTPGVTAGLLGGGGGGYYTAPPGYVPGSSAPGSDGGIAGGGGGRYVGGTGLVIVYW